MDLLLFLCYNIGMNYPSVKHNKARRLLGFAVQQDPTQIVDELDSLLPSRLATNVLHLTEKRIRESGSGIFIVDDTSRELLRSGIDDTQNILHSHLEALLNSSTPEKVTEFISHENTVRTLATIALRSEESMRNLIRHRPLLTSVNQAGNFLELDSYGTAPDTRRGCPFAGHDGNVEPDPLFTRFAIWSGTLCAETLSRHIKRQK